MKNAMPSRFDMIEMIFALIGEFGEASDPSNTIRIHSWKYPSLLDAMYLFNIPDGCTRRELFEIESEWKKRLTRESITSKDINADLEEEQQPHEAPHVSTPHWP